MWVSFFHRSQGSAPRVTIASPADHSQKKQFAEEYFGYEPF
jgi:hypothetical protein